MSAQYALAITDFSNDVPQRYRFGFIGSSDNHQARPGSGYKENLRLLNTESRVNMQNLEGRSFLNPRLTEPKLPKSDKVHFDSKSESSLPLQAERASSFLYTGGLVAVHSEARKRNSLWKAMNSREVYATSGERILLWFNLINHRSGKVFPMGSELDMEDNPSFLPHSFDENISLTHAVSPPTAANANVLNHEDLTIDFQSIFGSSSD